MLYPIIDRKKNLHKFYSTKLTFHSLAINTWNNYLFFYLKNGITFTI